MPFRENFGKTASGESVEQAVLRNGDLSASIITCGAALRDLRLEGHQAPLVLGFDRVGEYEQNPLYLGAIVGRFANRICGAQFELNNKAHHLSKNDGDNGNCLHGGVLGFSERVWTIGEQSEQHVSLQLVSEDGDMGFPGRLVAQCIYRLCDEDVLEIELSASCDAPTICAMAHHSYFNLADGGQTPIDAHALSVDADRYLAVDSNFIPAGDPQPVEGTRFDFRAMRTVGADRYDHNFCLSDGRGDMVERAILMSAQSGLYMMIETTEPGLQFYTGDHLVPLTGLDGINYHARSGLCLETQIWPDAPNRADFPSAVLMPGETLLQKTRYRFGHEK